MTVSAHIELPSLSSSTGQATTAQQIDRTRTLFLHRVATAEGNYKSEFASLMTQHPAIGWKLVDDADSADRVLITDVAGKGDQWWRLETLAKDPYICSRPESTFVYNNLDTPWCAHQGLYCSMPSTGFNRFRQRTVSYHRLVNPHIPEVRVTDRTDAASDILFSYMGYCDLPWRKKIVALQHPRAFLRDTSGFSAYNAAQANSPQGSKLRDYIQILLRSRFVVCPRGLGTSSHRLFEAMAAGSVPVIVADDFVPPDGPAWSSFSVRIKQKDISKIPSILESVEPQWLEMGRRAREAYNTWFAPEVWMTRALEACDAIAAHHLISERMWRKIPDPQRWMYRAAGWKARLRHKFCRSNNP